MTFPKTLVNCLCVKSGGGRAHLASILPRLAKLYHARDPGKFCLLVDQTQANEFSSIEHCKLITIEHESLGGYRRVLWERRNLDRIVDKHRIDLVYTPGQVLATRTRAKNVIFVQNMEPFLFHKYRYGWKTSLRNRLLRRASVSAATKADRVVACSQFVKDYLIENCGVAADKIVHIYHGRDTEFPGLGSASHNGIPVTGPFFLTCGSILPYRRCEDVISAFEQFSTAHPDRQYSLLIAGTGTDAPYRNRLEQQAADSAVSNRIRFLGHVDREMMSHLYNKCDACILATEIEACPITAIEAMTCRCRIISGTSRPMPEMLEDAAVFFEPRQIAQLAGLMEKVLEPPLSEDLAGRALDRSQYFDWDICARQTFAALTQWSD
ncbi:MAG: glycosyltransferase family 4 protein [Pirellulaceae bacterium]